LRVQATNWASCFEVTTDGAGVVGHAGAALLRELADRLGLTAALGWRQAGGRHRVRGGPAQPAGGDVAGDGRLGVVQGGELACGQAAFRLEFQVAQARPDGQCSRR